MQKLADFYKQNLKGKLLYAVHIYVLLLCISLSIFLKITSNIPYFLITLFILCFILVGIFVGFVYFLTQEKLKKIYRFINIKVTLVIILIVSTIIFYWFNERFLLHVFAVIIIYVGFCIVVFNYQESHVMIFMWYGFVPIIINMFLFFYIIKEPTYNDLAISLNLAYLYTFLLLLNNYRLYKSVFASKKINLKEKRNFKIINKSMISIAFIFLLILLNAYRIAKFFNFGLLIILQKLGEFMRRTNEPTSLPGDTTLEIMESTYVTSDFLILIVKIFYVLIIVVGIIGLIIFIIKSFGQLISLIQKLKNKQFLFMGGDSSDEYIETTKIERMLFNKKPKKRKNLYNMGTLLKIKEPDEKIRYYYGYLLEQLYLSGAPIRDSYTVDEIYELVARKSCDLPFTELFDLLTKNYSFAKYSKKQSPYSLNDKFLIGKYHKQLMKYFDAIDWELP